MRYMAKPANTMLTLWCEIRRRGWRMVLGRPPAAAVYLLGLAMVPSASGIALAQTEDLNVNGIWNVNVQADPTTDTICLVQCEGGADILCASPDEQGQAHFPIAESIAAQARCIQAIARNGAGDSGLSPNRAMLSARRKGDCNGDGRVTVGDFICVNTEIFGGG